MKLPTLLLALVLATTALFAALNWPAINTLSEVSLGVTTVQAPLGLVMLTFLVLLTALFLGFVLYMQGSALLETRRYSKELLANRTLADQAEASRFTDLRVFLNKALAEQAALQAETQTQLLARLARLEAEVQASVEQSGNTLAAYIGELEDRLEQRLPPAMRG
jgi:hypothetical protein